MSDLYRSAIHARLSKLPPMPPPEDDDDYEEGEEEESDSLGALPFTIPPTSSPRTQTNRTPNTTYAPISAAAFFDKALEITVPASQLLFRTYYTPPKIPNGTVMVCHHGAGYSGLSFACFAREVSQMSKGDCGVLSFDIRRHGILFFPGNIEWLLILRLLGKTFPTPDSKTAEIDSDLDIQTLTNDFVNLLTTIYPTATSAPSLLVR